MHSSIYVDWGGHNVRLTWLPLHEIKDLKQVTSVHGYCFHEGKILQVHIKGRGFNNPGGHVDEGETPQEAFLREAYEEGYVKGTIQYLGAIEVSHEENPKFDSNGKYPLIGYQLYYRMDITECEPFKRENESTTRIWVEPEEIPYIMDDHAIAFHIIEEALQLGRKSSCKIG
ncbi:hypothetical protein GCM10008967_02260 [Bacillus carboniphilus]|uniref:Nudix hydrolase domain-containing protein n=1 Tax=Bacillus carboniphilus TaxID=86663 RepID=A0ABN0VRC0_9BACI